MTPLDVARREGHTDIAARLERAVLMATAGKERTQKAQQDNDCVAEFKELMATAETERQQKAQEEIDRVAEYKEEEAQMDRDEDAADTIALCILIGLALTVGLTLIGLATAALRYAASKGYLEVVRKLFAAVGAVDAAVDSVRAHGLT